MQLTSSGQLLLGVYYQDELHYDFSVSLLTIGREIQALDMLESLNIDRNDIKSRPLIDMAYLAQQLNIEGIPAEELTPQFLLDNLTTDDYDLVLAQIGDLRKKRQGAGENLAPKEKV
ncbi:hypothetical protein [Otariodibacter oris]|uniref:Tail assembly chaperone E/41/14-like protein n=1 Tax=Otariodibacter oris TaxID=1032623 RepID=A0A420XJA9_9PAST|nr:hypothetical protein [Otariodibacter oris]QGM80660.1 hypothetical protein A6A10_04205 [Otariodibacter oris]RKR77180.1 hypothetical protein DES31_0505 [Otariodibacter oris]